MCTCLQLVDVAKATTGDVDLLQTKLSRKTTIEEANKRRQSQHMANMEALFGTLCHSTGNRLSTQRQALDALRESFSKCCSVLHMYTSLDPVSFCTLLAFVSALDILFSSCINSQADVMLLSMKQPVFKPYITSWLDYSFLNPCHFSQVKRANGIT